MSEFSVQNITLFIAVWGAVLSTYKILSDYRAKQRQVKVKVTNGLITQGNEVSPYIINISAINMGLRDVTLNSVGFLLPDGRKTIMMEQPVFYLMILILQMNKQLKQRQMQ